MKALLHLLRTPSSSWSRGRLYKIDEVDEYQRSNPFIRGGYRHQLSALSCLASTLSVHNETVNIWTHLLGFAFFLFLLVRDFVVVPTSASATLADALVLVGALVCYQACMILSSLFHTFTCHSKAVSERCLSLDLVGVSLALLATYLSGIYYAFWCQPEWRDFYLYTVVAITLVAAAAQLWPGFREYTVARISLFTAWAAYGLVPTIHWVWLQGGLDSPIVSAMVPRVFLMYALCALALVFYVSKLPERALPGLVDIIGHSHQWWHLLIFVALLFWHQTGITFALFRLNAGCSHGGDGTLLNQEALDELKLWPF